MSTGCKEAENIWKRAQNLVAREAYVCVCRLFRTKSHSANLLASTQKCRNENEPKVQKPPSSSGRTAKTSSVRQSAAEEMKLA